MEHRVKLWVGMGAWLLASASSVALVATPAKARESGKHAHTAPMQLAPMQLAQAHKDHDGDKAAVKKDGGEGGEGGEAGEKDIFADATPDEALLGRLLLIKGHLRVGQDLYGRGRVNDALPHYLHPAEELYEEIGKELASRKAKQFDGALKRLVDLVKAKADKAQLAEEQKKALAAIDTASRAVPAKLRRSPEFVAKIAVLVLKQAAEEYEEAFEGDKLANPVEYQDSRGFVWTARDLLVGAKKELQAKDAEAYGAMMAELDKLRTAWPSVVPPAQAKVPFAEVQAGVSQIELRASRFH